MPELPEVETVRKGLEPYMMGHKIISAEIRRPDLRWPFPDNMAVRLTGKRILRLWRRSKYILCDLESGETLLIHLGMSGRMTISNPGDMKNTPGHFHFAHPAPETHDHVIFDMENDVRIIFNDPRRFGVMDLCATDQIESHKLLVVLGPEPLSNRFDEPYLISQLKDKNTPIKSALLDQRIVAGLGNIYVCEALWRAGLSPLRKAGRISAQRVAHLVPAIRDVLNAALQSGGSSLRDYRQADGELGYFQHSFSVYDRENQPCHTPDCAGVIKRIVQSGRSSYYCPKCQR